MQDDTNSEDWSDVQFMFDGAAEFQNARFAAALEVLRKGIQDRLEGASVPIDTRRLLHTLRLLLSSIESSINARGDDYEGPSHEAHRRCGFCARDETKTTRLISGAFGSICETCIDDLHMKVHQSN